MSIDAPRGQQEQNRREINLEVASPEGASPRLYDTVFCQKLRQGDNSKHGSGIFVGKITATSDDEKRALASDTDDIEGIHTHR